MKGEEQMSMNLNTAMEEFTKEKVAALTEQIEGKIRAEMSKVKNRHEAFGLASEHLAELTRATKNVKNDVGALLDTLPDPNRPAVEATSAIRNSAEAVAIAALKMASVMGNALRDLYDEETDDVGPLFAADIDAADFDEAEPADE